MSAILFEPTRVSKLRRGMIARDITTGFFGMVVAVSAAIDGSMQVGIQPGCIFTDKGDVDRVPEWRWVDEQACEYVSDGKADAFTYAEPLGEWDFGDPVRDVLSGATGIISEFQVCRNGCVLACVIPKTDHAPQSPQTFWVSITRLQRITDTPKVAVVANTDSGPCDVRPGSGRRI